MSIYLIGDIHGCYDELQMLLKKVNFSKNKDTLWITGDLINRGPYSLKVLRYLKKIDKNVKIVLGNHDINLIQLYIKNDNSQFNKKTKEILQAPDIHEIINWLKRKPILQIDHKNKIIMTHAGIPPKWNLKLLITYAKEAEKIIRNKQYQKYINLFDKINSTIDFRTSKLFFLKRIQFTINALTKMRYCFINNNDKLYINYKKIPKNKETLLKPWFNFKMNIPKEYSVIFGHWSDLNRKKVPKKIYALDTGCCWGNYLTLLRWSDKKFFYQPSYIHKKK
ncbi:MAG: symmetrical bis(5'-nucleosyl)-tetraphosphatase [Arsenophonus sp.]|nr:MAG: symmetrical bis(5'-nucleosyl)-tetraphosphatase [Arsenophonus sp.]